MNALDLGNYASTRVIDELRRVPGVGDVTLFGSEYAMRIWLDPERLGLQHVPAEALAAVREQNSQTPGRPDRRPALPAGQQLNATDRHPEPLHDARAILADHPARQHGRIGRSAGRRRARRAGREQLRHDDAAQQEADGRHGRPARSGANALEAGQGVKDRMEALKGFFPADVSYSIPYDTTLFVSISIEEVLITLVEAMVLVFLVMFLFLQNFRATIIPTIVVPVALLGACLGLYFLGYLDQRAHPVRDGAGDRHPRRRRHRRHRECRAHHGRGGPPPREATYKAMGQIVSPIIGITLVLIAVFVPMAFFPGSTGGIYRQFSVTLAFSMAFSALLALTLTPALVRDLPAALEAEDRGPGPSSRASTAASPHHRPLRGP
jgi:multidrug efflux pump